MCQGTVTITALGVIHYLTILNNKPTIRHHPNTTLYSRPPCANVRYHHSTRCDTLPYDTKRKAYDTSSPNTRHTSQTARCQDTLPSHTLAPGEIRRVTIPNDKPAILHRLIPRYTTDRHVPRYRHHHIPEHSVRYAALRY